MARLFNQNKFKKQTMQQKVDAEVKGVMANSDEPGGMIMKNRDISADLGRMEKYLRDEKRGRSVTESTLRDEIKTIHIINRRYGIQYTYEWLSMVRADMLERELSKNTINTYLISLRNLFQANGYGETKVSFLKTTKQRNDKLIHSEQEIMQMVGAARGKPRDFAILNVMWYAALRRGEVCHLHVSDFNELGGSKGRFNLQVRDHGQGVKDHECRTIPLEMPCVNAIKAWLNYRDEHGITEDRYPSLFISSANGGTPISEDLIYKMVTEYAIRAGISKKSGCKRLTAPHAWRRSRATFLYTNGMPLPVIQKILGHSSLDMTKEYCMVTDDALYQYTDMINQRYKSGPSSV